MADVRPFSALRPQAQLASKVIAPPYDVLTDSEARAIAQERMSFVRVTRSEVDLPLGTDSHSAQAYEQAKTTLDQLIADGILQLDAEPTYYFYGQKMGDHEQIGILAAASVDEYDQNLIKKHEYTRPDKEDDRTQHMDTIDAQVGLVFLTYAATPTLSALTQQVAALAPAWQTTTDDQVEHRFWPAPLHLVDAIKDAFDAVPALYIADGHHRSAAASRIHELRKSERSTHFLAGLFPDDQLYVMAYNRVLHDLNGHSAEDFFTKVGQAFTISPALSPTPSKRGTYTMYLEGTWYSLRAKPGLFDPSDPVTSLDVSVLQDHLLQPLLGIDDPRRNTRIDFVGGIRGHQALSAAVDSGKAVAFHLFPTGLDQLFAVADKGEVMPPKSTWFEPKLREGVVVRKL